MVLHSVTTGCDMFETVLVLVVVMVFVWLMPWQSRRRW